MHKIFASLILAFLMSHTVQASEQLGTVVMALKQASAASVDGQSRTLRRGVPVYLGDRLITNETGKLQVLMNDQSMFSFDENTEFVIEQFNYNAENTSRSNAAFELIQGGLRTFSGLVGQSAPDNFQIKASVTTIGIRGTNYAIRICDAACSRAANTSPSVVGTVINGTIQVTTNTDKKTIRSNRFFSADIATGKIRTSINPPAGFLLNAPIVGGNGNQRLNDLPGAAPIELPIRDDLVADDPGEPEEILEDAPYVETPLIAEETAQPVYETPYTTTTEPSDTYTAPTEYTPATPAAE